MKSMLPKRINAIVLTAAFSSAAFGQAVPFPDHYVSFIPPVESAPIYSYKIIFKPFDNAQLDAVNPDTQSCVTANYRPENYNPETGMWSDSSQYQNHAFSPSAKERPINGTMKNGSLRFDGVDDYVRSNATIAMSSGYTIFVSLQVPKNLSDTTTSSAFNTIVSTGAYPSKIQILQNRDALSRLYSKSQGTGSSTKDIDTLNRSTVIVERAYVGLDGGVTTYANFQKISSSAKGTVQTGLPPANLYIGGDGTKSRGFIGDISRVVLCNESMSDKAMSRMTAWMQRQEGNSTSYYVREIINPSVVDTMSQQERDVCNQQVDFCTALTTQENIAFCHGRGFETSSVCSVVRMRSSLTYTTSGVDAGTWGKYMAVSVGYPEKPGDPRPVSEASNTVRVPAAP